MVITMPIAMIIGMIIALPLLMLFTSLLGGFEIIMVSMQVGMLAGMAGVMTPYNTLPGLLATGAVVGLLIQFLLHMSDIKLHGEVLIERPADE